MLKKGNNAQLWTYFAHQKSKALTNTQIQIGPQ